MNAGLIEKELKAAKIPGCSIAVVDSSKVLSSRGFGYADLFNRVPADQDTVYHLFSGTKLFTAVAVLRLAECGRLKLDDPVSKFVPEANAARGITLIHLLSHRSGLKDTLKGFLSVSFPDEKPLTTSQALAKYKISPARPPGERVEYRNVNYALLGEVVSRVSDVDYRDSMARNVLGPLGMHAGFAVTGETRARAATGYIGRWDPMRFGLWFIMPAVARRLYRRRVGGLIELNEYRLDSAAIGGLVGSVVDFGRFLQMQLAGGGGVLSRESTLLMQTMVAMGPAGIESRLGIGLGWKFGRAGSTIFLNHEGGGAGFTSELRLYPEEGIGIALAMNFMRAPNTMRVAHRICESVVADFRAKESA